MQAATPAPILNDIGDDDDDDEPLNEDDDDDLDDADQGEDMNTTDLVLSQFDKVLDEFFDLLYVNHCFGAFFSEFIALEWIFYLGDKDQEPMEMHTQGRHYAHK